VWVTVTARSAGLLPGLALAVALLAISSSAPLIVYATAPALAIAFWRNTIAIGVLAPVTVIRRRGELRRLAGPDGRRDGLSCVLAGLALAVHFGTWISSAKLTSVAMSTALVATQPVWQGLIALGQGRRLPVGTWVGIAVAVTGAVLATGADITVSARAAVGDLLAVAGGIAVAVYTALGERARASVSTTTYTTICYSVCAVLLGAVCAVGGVRVGGYDGATWLAILAMVAGPQFLGHSMINYALHRISATTVSVLVLLEVPGSALIGWLWLGQLPRPASLPGLALLVAGVAIVVLTNARAARRTADLASAPVPPGL
jgi:drug/metabolite transporter (DMT)-like permease